MADQVRKISILGAGMWGRTLAMLLAKNDIIISLWDIRTDLSDELNSFFSKMNDAGHSFDTKPVFTSNLDECVRDADIHIIAVPTGAVREVSHSINTVITHTKSPIVIATKGIEENGNTFSLLSQVVMSETGQEHPIGVLSGPNLSIEIQNRHPALSLIASKNDNLIETMMSLLASDIFRVYGSRDIEGVQIGGAVKNVIALAGGMVDKLGFQHNTKAALLTRGLVEIARLTLELGGKLKTVYGISGLGDLLCTASSPTSRNYRAGRLFGEGKKREDIIAEIGQVIEGISNSKTVFHLSSSMDIKMPICQDVYRVIWEDSDPRKAIQDLMARELKFE